MLRFRWIDHRTGPTPSTFLIKFRRSLVSDRTGKPGSLDTACRKASFCIGHQRRGDAEPRAGAETNN
jgi:hypothetical protein